MFWLLPSYPAMSRIYPRAPEAKVFWFFSSEKNTLFTGLKTAHRGTTPAFTS